MYKVFWRLDSIESIIYFKGVENRNKTPRWSPDTGGGGQRDQRPDRRGNGAGSRENTKTGGGRGGGGSSALPETTADRTGREQI